MKVRVTFRDSDLRYASLHVQPPWWKRLLGVRASDDTVEAVQSVAGTTLWLRNSTGRRIKDTRILEEIERALKAAQH